VKAAAYLRLTTARPTSAIISTNRATPPTSASLVVNTMADVVVVLVVVEVTVDV